jgi:hypothetical protein
MESSYVMITLAEKEGDIPLNKLIKKLPFKLYRLYLIKKVPVLRQEVYYFNKKGTKLILPFTSDGIKKYDKEYLDKFKEKVYRKHKITTSYINKELRKYFDCFKSECRWLLNYILFPQLFTQIVLDYNIDCKNLKLIIFDSMDRKINYLLEILVPHLNHLLIVTSRSSYFNQIVDDAYDYTGLMIEIVNWPLKEPILGNMIIDINPYGYKSYNYFQENAIVVDLNWKQEKLYYIISRRIDLVIIYDIEVKIGNKSIENELAADILCNINWKVNQFVYGNTNYHYEKVWEELIDEYKIELVNIIKIS